MPIRAANSSASSEMTLTLIFMLSSYQNPCVFYVAQFCLNPGLARQFTGC
jgi:hypothetical protein